MSKKKSSWSVDSMLKNAEKAGQSQYKKQSEDFSKVKANTSFTRPASTTSVASSSASGVDKNDEDTGSVAERIKAAREATEEKSGGFFDKLSAAASEMFGVIADRNKPQQDIISGLSDHRGKPFSIEARDIHVRQNYAQHEIDTSANEINNLFGDTSNVDYSKRKYLTGADMKKAGWTREQDKNLQDDNVVTTYSNAYTGQDWDDIPASNRGKYLELTPIRDDGTIMSPAELEEYAHNLLRQSDIKSADAAGNKVLMKEFDNPTYDELNSFYSQYDTLKQKNANDTFRQQYYDATSRAAKPLNYNPTVDPGTAVQNAMTHLVASKEDKAIDRRDSNVRTTNEIQEKLPYWTKLAQAGTLTGNDKIEAQHAGEVLWNRTRDIRWGKASGTKQEAATYQALAEVLKAKSSGIVTSTLAGAMKSVPFIEKISGATQGASGDMIADANGYSDDVRTALTDFWQHPFSYMGSSHPAAAEVGEFAGDIGQLAVTGGMYGAAKGLSPVAKTALTFGTVSGLNTASNQIWTEKGWNEYRDRQISQGMEIFKDSSDEVKQDNLDELNKIYGAPYSVWTPIRNTAISAVTGGLAGALGGAASQKVGGAVLSKLMGSGLTPRAISGLTKGAGGLAFGAVNAAIEVAGQNAQNGKSILSKDYEVDAASIAKNIAITAIWSALDGIANPGFTTRSNAPADEQSAKSYFTQDELSDFSKLQQRYRQYAKEYADVRNSANPDPVRTSELSEITNAYNYAKEQIRMSTSTAVKEEAQAARESGTASAEDSPAVRQAIALLNDYYEFESPAPTAAAASASFARVSAAQSEQIVPAAQAAPAAQSSTTPLPVARPQTNYIQNGVLQEVNRSSVTRMAATLGEHGQKAMTKVYDNGDATAYSGDFIRAYNAGEKGADIDSVQTTALTPQQKFAAFAAGQNDAKMQPTVKAEQKPSEAVQKPHEEYDTSTRKGQIDTIKNGLGITVVDMTPPAKEAGETSKISDAETGKKITVTGYHGEGKPKSEIYINGVECPIAGPAAYYSPSEDGALQFGKKITRRDVTLENPIVVRDDADWSKLTTAAGWEYPNPYGLAEKEIFKCAAGLKDYVKSTGHDGIIVDYEGDMAGDQNTRTHGWVRTLDRVLGGDQIISYENRAETPAVQTATETAPKPISTTKKPANKEPAANTSDNRSAKEIYEALPVSAKHFINKWAANEWVNVPLPSADVQSKETVSFVKFFDKWYNAGRNGTSEIDVPFDADTDMEFPTFLTGEFYNQGKKDAAKDAEKANSAKTKPTQAKPAVSKPAPTTEKTPHTEMEGTNGTGKQTGTGTDSETDGAGPNGGGVLEGISPEDVQENGGRGEPVPDTRPNGNGLVGKSGPDDEGRAGGGRSDGSDQGGDIRTSAGEISESTPKPILESKGTDTEKGSNFVIGESLDLPAGEKTRFKANVSAIRIMQTCLAEGRNATTEEQLVLSKYVGWGGLSLAFDDRKPEWKKEYAELKDLLSPEAYAAALDSTSNAHYTSIDVIKAMYDGLRGLGFNGGRLLEPACGTGNFVGAMPADMTATVKSWTMVELDQTTGKIAKLLYPNSDVRIQGFETALLPDNIFDVAISNVPFGNIRVFDKAYPPLATRAIHNYFFAKSLDKVRPGGLVVFVTSHFTMDSYDTGVREYIAERADLLGAIRLPNTAFLKNAGTEVITDILVLKKREPGTPYGGVDFIEAPYTELGTGRAYLNTYFKAHPEMALGDPAFTGGMYGRGELTYTAHDGDLGDQIREAFTKISGKIDYPEKPTPEDVNAAVVKATTKTKPSGLVAKGGKVYYDEDGALVARTDLSEKDASRITGMLDIRDKARALLQLEQSGASSGKIGKARADLNAAYDGFVKKFGAISGQTNSSLLKSDPDMFFVLSLENYDKATKKATKADVFTTNTVSKNVTVTHADSVSDALAVSVNETGGIDTKRIGELCSITSDDARNMLIDGGLAFQTRSGALKTAPEYLSGNVRAKLKEAEAMATVDKSWQHNVDALKEVLPADVPYQGVSAVPGATWVPDDVYTDFVAYMCGVENTPFRKYVSVTRNPALGGFDIVTDKHTRSSIGNRQTWGTADRTFLSLLTAVMNNKSISVGHTDEEGKYHVDNQATIAANEMAEKIKTEFARWLWDDEDRRARLVEEYNEKLNSLATPKYDGSALTIDGENPMKKLRPHQRDVVQRVVSSGGNTLIAHCVGAGKSGELAAAAMKLRQLGIVKKPMFVVPKSVLAQWGKEFLDFFPAAHILVASDKDMNASNRKVFANRIATGDYDAVIISYENFKAIPLSEKTMASFYQEQIDELQAAIDHDAETSGGKSLSVKQMVKKLKALKAKLQAIADMKKDENNIDFESLGVDGLFIDEAHNFKNLFYATNMHNVAGLGDKDGSQRAFDLYAKVRYLQQLNGGRGIVFATATPVMNSMSEMYIMEKYLMYGKLKELGLSTFDDWANQFGEVRNVLEIKPSGKGFRQKQSFSRFRNVPELTQLFRSIADIKTTIPGLKLPTVHRNTVLAQPSDFVTKYIDELDERATNVSTGRVDPKDDNMLKITSDGRKASYTQRMIDPSLPYEENCKISLCINNVFDIWKKTGKNKSTQLIFCDLATPKGKDKKATAESTDDAAGTSEDQENVQIYADIKNQLINKGVPADEIAFIHDANSDDKKEKLSADINAGRIRVLIGSTGKMGVGLNVQKKIVALHHLDAPWRPGDITQREGRGIRQGNENSDIDIYTYVTEGTFDARMWDNLQRKASFINTVMNGSTDVRDMEDIGEQSLSFAEIKAIASGNPLIQEQVEVSNKLQRLLALKAEHSHSIQAAAERRRKAQETIAFASGKLEAVKADLKIRKDVTGDKFAITINGKTYTEREKAGDALITALKKVSSGSGTEPVKVGEFGGLSVYMSASNDSLSMPTTIRGSGTYPFTVNMTSASGTVQSIEGALRGLDTLQSHLSESLETANDDVKKLDVIIDRPFEKQAELDSTAVRNNEILAELNPPDPNEAAGADDAEADDVADHLIVLDENSQSVGSAKTSVNGGKSGKLPALFTAVKDWKPGTVNLDLGGGQYDNATEYLKTLGVTSYILDKYNRSPEENARAAAATQEGQADTVTISNVLNVIREQSGRDETLRNAVDAVKPDGTVYITVYEGAPKNRGVGKYSQFDLEVQSDGSTKKVPISWQENRLTSSYIPEVRAFFGDVTVKNKVIIARQPKKNKLTPAGSIDHMLADTATGRWSAPRNSNAAAGKPMPISDIIGKARHDFGLPITAGHVRGKKDLGLYFRNSDSIRTKIANDLPTVAHELGHHLDRVYGMTEYAAKDQLSELTDGLSDAMRDAYPEKKWKTEGFAEFLRQYLQSIDETAKKYPKFTLYFLETLSPEDAKNITDLADAVNAYYALDKDTAQSSIRFREEQGIDYRTPAEKASDKADHLYQAWVTSNQGIKRFDRAAGTNAYMLATNAAYAENIAAAVLEGDLTDQNGQRVGDGLRTVLKDINLKSDVEYRAFGEYLVVKHAPERIKEGMRIFADDRKNSADWCAARQAILEHQYPMFKETSEKLYDFESKFLQTWGVDTGLVSQESMEKWAERWLYYVPLNRDVGSKKTIGARRGFADQNSTIRQAYGSGLDIIHPVDNIMNNVVKMINAGIRNNVMREITTAATRYEGLGIFLEQVDRPLQKQTFDMAGIKEGLNASIESSGLTQGDKDETQGIIGDLDDVLVQYKTGHKAGDVITVLVDGKLQYWKINDPLLMSSISNMSPRRLPAFLETLAEVNRFMVSNITGSNVLWSIFSNLPRDFMTAMTFSEDKNPLHMLGGMGAAYVNMCKGINADPLFKEFKAMGGTHASVYTADKDFTAQVRKKIRGDDKLKWLNPLDALEFIADMSETGPRFSYYRILRNKGYSPQEAFYASMDLTTNFRRSGTQSRQVNKIIPFFNPGVQGLDRFYRWATGEDTVLRLQTPEERAKTARGRMITFFLASAGIAALLHAVNSKTDEDRKNYAQLSNYTKNSYFCIPIGGGKYFCIPKPRELAVLTSAIEATLERTLSGDEHAFDEFYSYTNEQLLPNVLSDLAHGDIAGAIGSLGVIGTGAYLMANRDFLGKPIVSDSMQALEPKDQYTQRTSKLAYWIGQAFNISPLKVDFFCNNILGGWWKSQKALFPVGGEDRDLTLGVQGQYIKDNQYSTDVINRLYDANTEASREAKSNPDDMGAKIAAKWTSMMTGFYSNYNKLSKDVPDTTEHRTTRQTVLNMIIEFQKAYDSGSKTGAQKVIESVCKAAGSTEYMPQVMQNSVKDGDGGAHTLTDSMYVDYQTDYLKRYYEYVESVVSASDDASTQAMACKAAQEYAKEGATNKVLKQLNITTTKQPKSAQLEDQGIDADMQLRYQIALKKYDANQNGHTSQEEAENAIDSLGGLTVEQKSALWQFTDKGWKEKNNPYS